MLLTSLPSSISDRNASPLGSVNSLRYHGSLPPSPQMKHLLMDKHLRWLPGKHERGVAAPGEWYLKSTREIVAAPGGVVFKKHEVVAVCI